MAFFEKKTDFLYKGNAVGVIVWALAKYSATREVSVKLKTTGFVKGKVRNWLRDRQVYAKCRFLGEFQGLDFGLVCHVFTSDSGTNCRSTLMKFTDNTELGALSVQERLRHRAGRSG